MAGGARVSMTGMDEVEVAQLQIVDVPSVFDGSVVLLDVREDDEWQRGHAPGARHIPMGQVPSRIDEINPDAKLFVVCQAGGRSLRVAQYLARNGYRPGERLGRHAGLGSRRPSGDHRRRRYGRHLTGRR
jgi:rhodanese-related sulfurtransferase